MAPRRHRSSSHVQNIQKTPPPPQRTITPADNSQRQFGMIPAVYENNMKVLLRREPSITSIIDQFSHVCLYHHNGQKWEKHGYEGSMLLFEKSTYPTYGFYILNRMGTDDYVRPIYPEDDMEIIGDYLMCRFYPDFTKARLEMGLQYPIPQEHRSAFDLELSKRISPEEYESTKDKEKKGRSTTLGLWMFATDSREPLKEVMMRLHSYIKQGLPYPNEFRYGPGRPPPPNPHLRTASRSSVDQMQEHGSGANSVPPSAIASSFSGLPPTESLGADAAGSELDKLFAKLLTPSPSVDAPPPSGPPSAKSVHDLFAAMGGSGVISKGSQPPLPAPVPAPEPPQTGMALLQSIFASATPSGASPAHLPQAQAPPLPAQPEEIVIVSPKPTSSALPQILNQDVISTLLGLGPDSRASSAAPSSVGSRRSAQRYEGDNEFSEGDGTSEGEFAKSSTVRPPKGGHPRSPPALTVAQTPSSESEVEAAGRSSGTRRAAGDVTPRPPAGGARLPPSSPPHFQQRTTTPLANGKANGSVIASTFAAPAPAPTPGSAPRARPLVPFEANSDLWPYPRAPLDDRSFEQDDVVELDFNDTRALSDPAIFSSRLKEKKEKKEKGKKSRKEREKEKEREKAEIEKGWDLPTRTAGQPQYQPTATGPIAEAAMNSSQPKVVNSPKLNKKAIENGMNGTNGADGRPQNGGLVVPAAKNAIFAAMTARPRQADLGCKEFVRELLTLIHTDPQFVDNLWKEYLAHAT